MPDDPRRAIYQHFQDAQHQQELPATRISATRILNLLFERFRPASLIDVGCGLGGWLAAARDLGIADLAGLENDWTDYSRLVVEPSLIHWCDLENGFSLGRRFDLVVCIEVAEHLSAAAADRFVESLTAHGDLVLFSAAIPFQGGLHHVNEQFPDYWAERFARHAFRPLDFIRPALWNDPEILWWLRQNTLVFAHDRILAQNEKLRGELRLDRPLSVVHPDVYLERIRNIGVHEQIMQFLSQGGTFSATTSPTGELNLTRL